MEQIYFAVFQKSEWWGFISISDVAHDLSAYLYILQFLQRFFFAIWTNKFAIGTNIFCSFSNKWRMRLYLFFWRCTRFIGIFIDSLQYSQRIWSCSCGKHEFSPRFRNFCKILGKFCLSIVKSILLAIASLCLQPDEESI